MSQKDRRRAKQNARRQAETLPVRFAVSQTTWEALSAEWETMRAGHFDGRTGNIDTKTGTPLFNMKSNPGFQRTRTERGTTIRSGKGGTLKLQRLNPAAGEERAPRETLSERLWRTVESVERDPDSPEYGTIAECIPPTMQTSIAAEIRAGNHIATLGTGTRLANNGASE